MCDIGTNLYNLHVQSAKCFVARWPESGFNSRVGNEKKPEFLTHMKHRANASKVIVDAHVVDLTESEMPHLAHIHHR